MVFSHIKRSRNKVADILANEGVGKASSFHVEFHAAKMDNRLWEKCEKVAASKYGGANPNHPPRQDRGVIIKSPTSPHANLPLARGSPISSRSLSKIHVMRHAEDDVHSSWSGLSHAPILQKQYYRI